MKKRVIAIAAAALIVSYSLFAADSASMYRQFSESLSDPGKAIGYYDSMKSQIEKETKKAKKSLEKALNARNASKANEAYGKLYELSSYGISETQTSELLSSIISSGSDMDEIKWLYDNSLYYKPVLTLNCVSSYGGRRMSWTKTISMEPGSTIELPSIDSYGNGIFRGWGITPDSVTYDPGSSISMPITDQTLYAIFADGIEFSDSVTGFSKIIDGTEDGQTVDVPVLASDDGSYIFAGWSDSSGDYIPAEENEYQVDGKGTVFHALWKKAEITDLDSRFYPLDSIPLNTQVELGFSLANKGTEDLKGVTVTLSSDSDDAVILRNHAYIPVSRAGSSLDLKGFTFAVKAAGSYTFTVTVSDSDGNVWSSEVSVNAE